MSCLRCGWVMGMMYVVLIVVICVVSFVFAGFLTKKLLAQETGNKKMHEIGDPFKDTAGPSLHVLIKLLGTITLVLAPLFV